MGFDWQAFATGFLKQTASNIKESKDEARDYEERQRDLAERNVKTISRRRAVANQVTGIANMLRSNGASDKVIQAAISAGPQAISELATKVEKARSSYGRSLSSDDIDALINIPEGFSPIDMDTDTFIRNTYGLGYEGAGVTADKPERTFMDRLTGRKQMDMARARLDSELMQEGLTAYDINQMAAQEDYESLVPGTFVSFVDAKVFNPATDMLDFTRTFSSLVGDVMESADYEAVTRDIRDTQMNANLTDEEKASELKRLTQERDALIIRAAGPTIENYAATYGESFTDAASGYLRNYLSSDYVDTLSMEEQAEEEPDVPTIDVVAQTERALGEPATATSITTPEVTVTALPDAEVAEEGSESGPVDQGVELETDDMSIALLEKSGTDILDYLKEKGVSSTEEMAIALNEWGQENGMMMPFDKGALIFALKPYVLED